MCQYQYQIDINNAIVQKLSQLNGKVKLNDVLFKDSCFKYNSGC